jgi:anti-sigma B factor antagonist
MSEKSSLILTIEDGVAVVGFAEPTLLNAYQISEVGEQLFRLVEEEGHRLIVLDLSTIQMLSSQSLGVFLNLRHKLEAVQGKVVFSGMDPSLSRVFKITKLEEVFEFYKNNYEAVQQLKLKQ